MPIRDIKDAKEETKRVLQRSELYVAERLVNRAALNAYKEVADYMDTVCSLLELITKADVKKEDHHARDYLTGYCDALSDMGVYCEKRIEEKE